MTRHRRIVCISDTHLRYRKRAVPDGDILIHAGDLTMGGSLREIAEETAWLRSLPHRHKVLIAGNHDFGFQRAKDDAIGQCAGLTYLEDQEVTIEGLRIWGSPWQPWFRDWAFNLRRGEEIRKKWDLIPAGLDILVTHGPPLGFGDRTDDGEDVGCADLRDAIRRLRPRFHVAGHIHEGHGVRQDGPTTIVNASVLDASYRPVHDPIVLEA